MLLYFCQRVAYVVGIVLVVSLLIFSITQIMPGNVAYVILGDFAPLEQIHALEEKLGFNDPWYVQYWRWLSQIARLDFGDSLIMERPIGPILWQAVANSAVLAVISIVLVAVIGIWLGVVSAVRHGKASDHVVSIGTYIVLAVPEFFWCIVLIVVFAGSLQWLPATGYTSMDEGFFVWASHLVLPVVALVMGLVAHVSRLTRSSMLEVMQSPYVVAARARGIPEARVIRGHALPNALLPTITVLAIDIGVLMGGMVVVETIFSYPGLGRLLIFGIQQLDLPLIQAAMMVVAVIYALANLLADVLYAFLNPRIRFGKAAHG
ncbi:ABC transporter permease [Acuticoccus yangtzensis]|uniref:ABC transporter permease n=1 Tax=Acuticoccus yangtzensis TaxID=1443441 RepID=UPI0009495264|nr:ABC transporter permease [Acuticoccus yangtzensis]